jgi:hypothetical protein
VLPQFAPPGTLAAAENAFTAVAAQPGSAAVAVAYTVTTPDPCGGLYPACSYETKVYVSLCTP